MSRQETYSVSEIKTLCAQTDYLDSSDIHEGDKGVSFDGNIVYFKNKIPKATGNEILIPVQIKGKAYKKIPTSHAITYSIKKRDLDNFYKNCGVIFFVVAFEEKPLRCKTFAKILLPVDIIELRTGKENQRTLSIALNEIKDADELLQLCKLFAKNRMKQSIVITGDQPDISKSQKLTFSGIKSNYSDPAITIAKSTVGYLYADVNGIDIPIPASGILTSRDDIFFIETDEYASHFNVRHIYSADKTDTIIAEAIKLTIDQKTKKLYIALLDLTNISFDKSSEIARLLVALKSSNTLKINGTAFVIDGTINKIKNEMSDNFIEYMKRMVCLADNLKLLNLPLSSLNTDDVCNSANIINSLKMSIVDKIAISIKYEDGSSPSDDHGIYFQKIGRKIVIIEYEQTGDQKYLLNDYLRCEQTKIGVFCEVKGEYHRISKWFAIPLEQISNVIFDRKQMIKDLSISDNNFDVDCLNSFILSLLHEYDKNHNVDDLIFIRELQNICNSKDPDSFINKINSAQISYRQGVLSEEEKTSLLELKIQDTTPLVLCCICILLKQHEEFNLRFSKLKSFEQDSLKQWPIYNLLQ